MRRVVQSLVMGLALSGLAMARPDVDLPRRQQRCLDGEYAVTFRGYYSGNARATVSRASIHLSGTVRDPSGNGYEVNTTLPVSGPYVWGTATIGPGAATVVGRLDAARTSRLGCTYRGAALPGEPHGLRSGRIAGILPTDVGDEEWDVVEQRPSP